MGYRLVTELKFVTNQTSYITGHHSVEKRQGKPWVVIQAPEYICIIVLRELLYTASLPELLAQFFATVNAAAGGQSQLLPVCT